MRDDAPVRRPVIDAGEIRCECGERLLEGVDDQHVVLAQRSFLYRRTTDHVHCDHCHLSYGVGEVRAALAATRVGGTATTDPDDARGG